MRFRLTPLAQRDVALTLAESARRFGPHQSVRYLEIIRNGISFLAVNPDHPTARRRHDLGRNVRSCHLQLAAKRRGGASHVLFYRVDGSDDAKELVILRVLSDKMDPGARVALAAQRERGSGD